MLKDMQMSRVERFEMDELPAGFKERFGSMEITFTFGMGKIGSQSASFYSRASRYDQSAREMNNWSTGLEEAHFILDNNPSERLASVCRLVLATHPYRSWHVDRGSWYRIENGAYFLFQMWCLEGKLPKEVVEIYAIRHCVPREGDTLEGVSRAYKECIGFGLLSFDAMPEFSEVKIPRKPDASLAYVYNGDVEEKAWNAWAKAIYAEVTRVHTAWYEKRQPLLMQKFELAMIDVFGSDVLA